MSRFFDEERINGPPARRPRRRPLLEVSTLETRRGPSVQTTALVVSILAAAALAIYAVWAGLSWAARRLYTENPRFTIRRVVIQGGSDVGQRLAREYTRIAEGTNLFAFSIAATQRRVLSRAYAFRHLDILRRLPDTVEITLVERVPVARVDSPWNLVADGDGMLFAPLGRSAHLPLVTGCPRARLQPGQRLEGAGLAALHLLEACEDPAMGLDVEQVRADAADRLTLIVNTASGRKEVTCAWEGMGRRTPESRASLLRQLALIREALATPQARAVSRLDATFEGRAYGK